MERRGKGGYHGAVEAAVAEEWSGSMSGERKLTPERRAEIAANQAEARANWAEAGFDDLEEDDLERALHDLDRADEEIARLRARVGALEEKCDGYRRMLS